MACQLSFTYSSNYNGGDHGDVSFAVPDGSYVTAYVNWISRSPAAYDVRSNGSQGEVIIAGPFYPPSDFAVSYSNFSNSCPPIATSYDCINGACTPKTTYNTPGLYATLSACQTACGTGCSGQCISNSDWAQIEGLSGQLRNRNCS